MAFELIDAQRKPVNLAMQSLWLTGRVMPVGAVLLVRHEFEVGGSKNVEAVYCFGLPRDAALRRFQLKTGSMVSHSELRPTEEALKEYERGIESGSLSALARQYGDGLVNLSVGNIRPGEKVVVDLEVVAGVELRDGGLRLRFPFTLAPSYHKGAKPVSPEPGWGELELPQGEFGDLLLPRWAKDAHGLHRVGFDLELQMGSEVRKAGSPSHRIQMERGRVALAAGGDLPDRDLVLDLEAGDGARVLMGLGQISAIVPSTEFGTGDSGPRDVVLLIDSSGSMSGAPLEQAKSAALACLAALEPTDRFGVAMFGSETMLWKKKLEPATKVNRDAASKFLAAIDAAGGTELGPAIETVAGLLAGSGGEVLLLTDGQVFGGEAVLATARRVGLRLHTLGIGSASQDRMLTLLARETGGVSRFVTARERVDQAALEVFAGAGRAVARGIEAQIEGTVTVPPNGNVYTGSPVSFMGRLSEGAAASVVVKWEGGERTYAALDGGEIVGETLKLLEGARRITDLDCRLEASAGSRENSRIRRALRLLSEEYGLASREMSLVAVMQRHGDVPGSVPHTMVVPVGLPEDMEMGGVFSALMPCAAPASAPTIARKMSARPAMRNAKDSVLSSLKSMIVRRDKEMEAAPAPPADPVVQIATMLEDDGGMPGRNKAERIENSLKALAIFFAAGVAFAAHTKRLVAFLQGQSLGGMELARLDGLISGREVCQDPEVEALALVGQLRR